MGVVGYEETALQDYIDLSNDLYEYEEEEKKRLGI